MAALWWRDRRDAPARPRRASRSLVVADRARRGVARAPVRRAARRPLASFVSTTRADERRPPVRPGAATAELVARVPAARASGSGGSSRRSSPTGARPNGTSPGPTRASTTRTRSSSGSRARPGSSELAALRAAPRRRAPPRDAARRQLHPPRAPAARAPARDRRARRALLRPLAAPPSFAASSSSRRSSARSRRAGSPRAEVQRRLPGRSRSLGAFAVARARSTRARTSRSAAPCSASTTGRRPSRPGAAATTSRSDFSDVGRRLKHVRLGDPQGLRPHVPRRARRRGARRTSRSGVARRRRPEAFADLPDQDDVRDLLEEVLRLCPNHPGATTQLALLWLRAGIRRARRGDPEGRDRGASRRAPVPPQPRRALSPTNEQFADALRWMEEEVARRAEPGRGRPRPPRLARPRARPRRGDVRPLPRTARRRRPHPPAARAAGDRLARGAPQGAPAPSLEQPDRRRRRWPTLAQVDFALGSGGWATADIALGGQPGVARVRGPGLRSTPSKPAISPQAETFLRLGAPEGPGAARRALPEAKVAARAEPARAGDREPLGDARARREHAALCGRGSSADPDLAPAARDGTARRASGCDDAKKKGRVR